MEPPARDETPRPESYDRVRELARTVLVLAVDQRRTGRPWDGSLTSQLRNACEAAREQRLHAEQLLILVKQAWRHLAESQALAHDDAEDALREIITRCIKEFYRLDGPT